MTPFTLVTSWDQLFRVGLFCLLAVVAVAGCDTAGRVDTDQCMDAAASPRPATDSTVATAPTAVDVGVDITELRLSLSGNTVQYALPRRGTVRLTLLNGRGQRIAALFAGCAGEGTYTLRVSAQGLSPGVYAVRLHFRDQTRTETLRVVPRYSFLAR
jgi:hypothetical protein